MKTVFRKAKLYDDKRLAFLPGTLVIEEDKICDVIWENGNEPQASAALTPMGEKRKNPSAPAFSRSSEEVREVDAKGALLIPGLIDLHTHGRNGYDFTGASEEELKTVRNEYARTGVTTVVPTLASDTFARLLEATARIEKAGFPAIHWEGRYLNPKKRGAHKEALLSALNPAELSRIKAAAGSMSLHITAALELDQQHQFLKEAAALGITMGLGHTEATFEEAEEMLSSGLSSFSHWGNTMAPFHHRAGGALTAALLSDAYVELIPDGYHISPEVVRLYAKNVRPERRILITDSMMATGMPDGTYEIAGSPCLVKDKRALTLDGAIAGSTLDLLDGVKNFSAFTGISFAETLLAVTKNPATLLSLSNVGRLEKSYRADFLLLNEEKEILAVYQVGKQIR